MAALNHADDCACRLQAPERNLYFHGKMLDVRNFQLETDYHNHKRWLVNRLVVGRGVVCGLNVKAANDDCSAVLVEPGFAIDRWGREIVVDAEVGPLAIPPELLPPPPKPGPRGDYGGEGGGYGEPEERRPEDRRRRKGVHLLLCYHECTAEPTPVLAGDCRDEEPCHPGLIRERFKLEFRPGCLPPREVKLGLPDVISPDGRVDYETLVKALAGPCPCPDDPCIPLANVFVDDDSGDCRRGEIDLTVRPIVYSNELLLQLILSAVAEAPSYRRE